LDIIAYFRRDIKLRKSKRLNNFKDFKRGKEGQSSGKSLNPGGL